MENLTEWTIGRPTKEPQTSPAVKVVRPRYNPVTFILHDFIDVMLMKMKGLFADIFILHYELYCLYIYFLLNTLSLLICSVLVGF